MIATFRGLLALSIGLFAVTYWLPYVDAGWFPAGMNDMRTYDGLFGLLQMTRELEIVIYMLGIAIPAAMYFFVRGSRLVFVAFTAILLFAHLAFGVRVLTPVDVFVGDLIALLDGAILALAFSPPVASCFEHARAPRTN